MKKIIGAFPFFLAFSIVALGQAKFFFKQINFDNGQNMEFIKVDTSLVNNIWQIGKPQKSNFTQAYSIPNAIVTYTVLPYPENNLSRFYLYVPVELNSVGQHLSFSYKIFSDSLTDFGKIEFSADKGHTWHDLLAEANLYGNYWFVELTHSPFTILFSSNDPINPFTGYSFEWYNFIMPEGSFMNFFPYVDTAYYRFTFQSDGIQTNKDGWMIDEIWIGDTYEGIEENNNDLIVTTVPNPFLSDFTLNITSEKSQNRDDRFMYEIYSAQGEKIIEGRFNGKTIRVDAMQNVAPGVYFIKVKTDRNNLGINKIVKI